MRKLPVFASFKEVYAGVFSHFIELVRVAWLPLTIWVGLSLLGNWWVLANSPMYDPDTLRAMSEGKLSEEKFAELYAAQKGMMVGLYSLMFVEYFFLSIAAVGFHRFVLLGEGVRGQGGLVIGRAELLYVWSLIKIGLLFFLLNFLTLLAGLGIVAVIWGRDIFSGPTSDGSVIAIVLFIYLCSIVLVLPLFARSALVLPHVALGNRSEIREIWRRTKGNGLRLAGYFISVVFTATIATFLVLLPVYSLFGIGFFSGPEQLIQLRENMPWMLVQYAIGIPFGLIWTMLSITMLSVAYREIIGLPGGEGASAGAEPASAV